MARRQALTVCSVDRCPNLTRFGRCDDHRREAEQARGTARERGYDREHETRFRAAVLRRDPACVCTDQAHGHGNPCGQTSRHADHWPLDRKALVAARQDPNHPAHGRGLCGPCHSSHTAAEQPGGWNR